MRDGFTLLEVLASVVLLFIIGMALTEISSKNLKSIEHYRNTHYGLASLAIYNENDYRDINDYSSLSGIPKWDITASKKIEFENELSYQITEDESSIITITVEKITINLDGQDSVFYRFR